MITVFSCTLCLLGPIVVIINLPIIIIIIIISYTCPDRCVDWHDMCQGVSFCPGDEAFCGENLRCPRLDEKDEDVEKDKSIHLQQPFRGE